MADREAFKRVAEGDHAALGEVYDRHGRLLYSLALRIAGDPADAEDIVQDVFTQAWRNARRYDARRGTVLGWLLTPTDEQLAWAGRASEIRTAVHALSVLQRVAIELAFYEGLTQAQPVASRKRSTRLPTCPRPSSSQ